jgi:hypothetical protein
MYTVQPAEKVDYRIGIQVSEAHFTLVHYGSAEGFQRVLQRQAGRAL